VVVKVWSLDISRRERRVFPRFFDFDPDGDDLSLAGGRKEGRADRKNRDGGERESERERGGRGRGGKGEGSARMTLNPTAAAPNPRYRGANPLEKETQERESEIERTERERKRGDHGGRPRGDISYIRRREERREREIPPWRESTVPEINTPASCDHSSCHAPLLSSHIRCLSCSLPLIPFSLMFSLSLPLSFDKLSLALFVSPLSSPSARRDLHPSGSSTPHSRGRRHLAPNRGA